MKLLVFFLNWYYLNIEFPSYQFFCFLQFSLLFVIVVHMLLHLFLMGVFNTALHSIYLLVFFFYTVYVITTGFQN